MIWYGLTQEEAATLCKVQGLPCRFTVTMNPKPAAETSTVPKVIRAKEENGVMLFLVGYFAKGDMR